MTPSGALRILLLAFLLGPSFGHAAMASDAVTLEKIFPEKSPFGPSASNLQFSHDGRYGAWLWRPWNERRHGSDLWIIDTQTGEVTRLTSVSVMSQFQEATRRVRDDRVKKAQDRRKKEAAEAKEGDSRRDEKSSAPAKVEDSSDAPAPDPLLGDWEGTIRGLGALSGAEDEATVHLTLSRDEQGAIGGTIRTQAQTATVTEASWDASAAKLTATLTDPETGTTAALEATIAGEELTGTLRIAGIEPVLTLSMKRVRMAQADVAQSEDAAAEKAKEDAAKDEEKKKQEKIDADTVDDKDAEDEKSPRYGGIQSFVFAPESNELIFGSAGDLYRLEIPGAALTRLTRSSDPEFAYAYLPDGSGYTFVRGGHLMRVRWGSHLIEQIDPALGAGESFGAYALSRDGRRLAFTAATGDQRGFGGGVQVAIVNYRSRFAGVSMVNRHMPDSEVPVTQAFVYVHDLDDALSETHAPVKVASFSITGFRDILTAPEWAEDSSRFAFSFFQQSDGQVTIHEVAVTESAAGGEAAAVKQPAARPIYRFLHNGGPTTPGMIAPAYLADSRRLTFLTELSGFRQLHRLDPRYEQLDQLTHGRYEIYPREISKDRRHLIALTTRPHPAEQAIERIDLETGEIEPLSRAKGYYDSPAVSRDARWVLANFVDWGGGRELVLIDTRSGENRRLTQSHGPTLAELIAPIPEHFSYENRHGQRLYGHLFKPDDWTPADKRPLMLYFYGGPLGTQKMISRGSYAAPSYFFAWYMAKKHGFIAATIDPRGASGFGALYERSNFEQVGRPQVDDLVDGARWLVQNAGVDESRIGIHGWSFGGFQTQMCLYLEPDFFKCGIAGAGPTEWENYNTWYTTGTIASAVPGKTAHDRFSLLPLAKNLKARLLLVHGMEDPNVLYQDTVHVYRELLKAGKEALVELFLDPTGGHGLGGDVKTIGRHRKYEEFFLRCLGTGQKADGESAPAPQDDRAGSALLRAIEAARRKGEEPGP